MFLLFEIADLATVKTFLVGIPESIELLVFGIGPVVAVVLLRWLLGRGETEKSDEKI